MKISATDPETGSSYEAEAKDVNEGFVGSMSDFDMSDDQIKRQIDNLNVSADVKSLLYKFSKATIKAGEFILKIGRKILDFICQLVNKYPNATFGMIFGAIAGVLIATIPVIGAVLASIFAPIAIAFGLIAGLKEDIKDNKLAREIARINASFSPLGAE